MFHPISGRVQRASCSGVMPSPPLNSMIPGHRTAAPLSRSSTPAKSRATSPRRMKVRGALLALAASSSSNFAATSFTAMSKASSPEFETSSCSNSAKRRCGSLALTMRGSWGGEGFDFRLMHMGVSTPMCEVKGYVQVGPMADFGRPRDPAGLPSEDRPAIALPELMAGRSSDR